ncbi:hypothetical protein EYF80_052398 [Liparis tanakae]|uniref:Uncharacterized protein n=1 Tax=Liparis tanakae TaxID=230148 RepID=A0A4Z2F8Z5_9TELE|nr:hypothetical protein EYF80_052398 [Liparis tanakae]
MQLDQDPNRTNKAEHCPLRPSDVAHRLVHGGHHAGVQPAVGVLDETVGGQVALGHLQGAVDGLQRHVEEERLRDGRERHVQRTASRVQSRDARAGDMSEVILAARQVPLAHHVGVVARLLHALRQQLLLQRHTVGLTGPDDLMLHARVDLRRAVPHALQDDVTKPRNGAKQAARCGPHLVPPGHELVPGRCAQGLDVVVIQPDSSCRQLVQVRGDDLRVVIADIVPTEVIRQDEDDPGPRGLGEGQGLLDDHGAVFPPQQLHLQLLAHRAQLHGQFHLRSCPSDPAPVMSRNSPGDSWVMVTSAKTFPVGVSMWLMFVRPT